MAHHRIPPGTTVRLDRFDTGDTGKHVEEDQARAKLARDIDRLAGLQDVLYAERRHAVLVKAEQRRRLRERLDDPRKNWKFSEADVRERALWKRYTSSTPQPRPASLATIVTSSSGSNGLDRYV